MWQLYSDCIYNLIKCIASKETGKEGSALAISIWLQSQVW